MMRMLVNLMQNAVLYGVVGPEVRTWTGGEANTACVVIADHGKRLGSEDPEALKQPFKRGGGDGQPKGTGFGGSRPSPQEMRPTLPCAATSRWFPDDTSLDAVPIESELLRI
ncbi:hypothetical protein BG57_23770 [Caballeronia grimmiae]|uniref:Histidine kinase/HSP90-like ATPase domain-containing protein n=1 Tax=Caballeronia grimmiae TaxID=1071679 RepID=A0A069NFF5_9BURK|nr:hypothetical protein BG57_23770 [Caballeronia grimmiae]GGD89497.1 hypothetical protein GCM10010985_50150 [Caballeronia grimmiae]